MKRTFLAKRNALLSSTTFSWGVGALIFALLTLFLRLLAPNLFLQAFTPVFHISDSIAAESHLFFSSFGDTAALTVRNEQLASENSALASENQMLVEKEASVNALLGVASTRTSGILAGVVARPPASPYDTLVLAAGKDAGVALGQEAFGEGGVPLGMVSAVTADFSRVTLFSAPNAVTHGWVGKANIPLTISGTGGGSLSATLSRSAGVAVDDIVFVPGPGQLPIGTVVRIDSDPSSPGVMLRIVPKVNPFSVSWVLLRDTGSALRDSFSVATSTL